MSRSMLRVGFALVVALSLAFGLFAGVGTSQAYAASGTNTAGGISPNASTPGDTSYCYPSGYNRQGWRCGWRLAAAPYNLGDYYRYYYGYNYNYGYNYGYNGYYGYYGYPGYYGGTGGYPTNITDYGGLPRFGYYWYNGYYYPYGYRR